VKTLILGALLAAFAAPTARSVADEVTDPVALLQAQVVAWIRGDLTAFCEVYGDDATFLSPSGLTRGRQAVLDRYRKRYPDRAAMGTLALDPIESRPTSSRDASIVSIAAHWSLSYPDKPVASGLTLLVMHRIGARWQIVQDASF
jgi:ketosteroid isomerase-like protein